MSGAGAPDRLRQRLIVQLESPSSGKQGDSVYRTI